MRCAWCAVAALAMVLAARAGASGDVGAAAPRSQEPALSLGDARPDVALAQRHFRRGVELYRESDVSGALAEFRRAYELAPNYKILFNLGQVSYQLRDYATALRNFRDYLAAGASEVPASRRREIESELPRLEERVGHLDLRNVDRDDTIVIDEIEIGTGRPLAPIPANVGRRKVELVSAAGSHRARFVDVTGGETVLVLFPRSTQAPPPAPDGPWVSVDRENQLPLVRDVERRRVPADAPRGRRLPAWLGWSAVGLLGAGAGITGVMALAASRDLERGLDTFPVTQAELDGARQRVRRLALTTDILLSSAVIAAAFSLYLTLRGAGDQR